MASEPQRMEQSELEYIFNSLKPKQAISVWFNSAVRSADSWTELQVGRKSKSKKYNLEKISLTNPKNPKGSKYYLYNRQGRISFAMGDMGTSLIAIKTNEIYESEGLKYMRDGDVRIINVGDRDYRVTKVMPEKGDTFNPYYHVRLNLSGITAEIVKQGSTWTYYTNARLQPLLNQKFKNPMAALEDIKEKESRGEFGMGDKLAESFSADTISVKGEAFYPSNGLPFKGAGYTLYVLGECCVRAHQNSRNYHFCPTCGLSQQLARKMINEDIIFLNDKLMGYSAESFSADERKFVEVLVEYNLPGDPEYIYDLLEGANMKIIEMKDYYGAESFSADDQTRHYKNLGIGAALVAGLAYWFKR